MKICVIGGANADITATSRKPFRAGDSNPGKVRVSWGGVGRNIAHNLALLGDEVELLTIFGGGIFGRAVEAACKEAGIFTGRCETAPEGVNSFFVSMNDSGGELIGGIADMAATEGMTPQWLAGRLDAIKKADAVVADANSSPESLAYLIDHCSAPLYLDAVSGAKAPRIEEAVRLSCRNHFHALKCNILEYQSVPPFKNIPASRKYVSLGAEGLMVVEEGLERRFPALPCTPVNTTGGGDALLAGIVHAGPGTPVEDCVRAGLLCARCAVESPDAVSEEIKNLRI